MITPEIAAYLEGLASRLEDGTYEPADLACAAALIRDHLRTHSGERPVKSKDTVAELARLFGPGILRN